MQTWKTIVVIILLVIVGGYAYYLSREPAPSQTPKLFALKAADIKRIELRSPDHDIVAERSKGGWQLVKPVQADADRTTVDGIADAIANLEITSTVEDTADLAPFGLKNPAVEVIVTTKDGHTLPSIMVGKDTPVGNSAYIKSAQKPGILLVANSFPSEVEKSTDDLRSRVLIGFTPDEIHKVVLDSNNGTPLELDNKGGKWNIVEPRPYPADSSSVQSLLDSITNARVADFIDDNPEDLSKYGLANPSLKIVLYGGKSNAEESLLFGFKQPASDKDALYARLGNGNDEPVITLDNYVFKALDKSFDDLRDKTVLALERDKVARIAITSGSFEETVERGPGTKWTVSSNGKSAPAEGLVTDSLLDQLHDLKASSILQDPMTDPQRYGMVNPTLTIAVTGKDGKEIGTLRLSMLQATYKPKPGAEGAQNKPTTRNFAYATSSTDKAVYEIQPQMMTDLENTATRLHSDTTSAPAASPGHAAASAAATPGASPSP
ncbi:MAG TPA: DUF4340 domain-containing protein [Candidatus Binataceae bacterium]|nr:DUF4340 domain-containing protein [Candidatus Binataceae bacterium]